MKPLMTKIYLYSLQIIDRPGVDWAVLQTASSLIDSLIQSVSQPFPKISAKTFTLKPLGLGS